MDAACDVMVTDYLAAVQPTSESFVSVAKDKWLAMSGFRTQGCAYCISWGITLVLCLSSIVIWFDDELTMLGGCYRAGKLGCTVIYVVLFAG